MNKKRLIVNADDFGMSKEITDGIIKAHQDGIVTSTSLMVNMPDSERAASLVKQIPSLDVGIHLNLTDGYPILESKKVSSLVDESGRFLGKDIIIPKLRKLKINHKEIESEFSAQIDRMIKIGINPSHIDSHHHVHIYPKSVLALKRVAKKYNIGKTRITRFYLIYTLDQKYIKEEFWQYKRICSIKLKNIYKTLLHGFYLNKLKTAEYRVSPLLIFPIEREIDFKVQWLTILESLPMGVFEAACHPGYLNNNMKPIDCVAKRRYQELDALTDGKVKNAVKINNVELINFKDL